MPSCSFFACRIPEIEDEHEHDNEYDERIEEKGDPSLSFFASRDWHTLEGSLFLLYPAAFPQQCLYFLPDPQPQESLRPIFRSARGLARPSSAAILRRSGPKYS